MPTSKCRYLLKFILIAFILLTANSLFSSELSSQEETTSPTRMAKPQEGVLANCFDYYNFPGVSIDLTPKLKSNNEFIAGEIIFLEGFIRNESKLAISEGEIYYRLVKINADPSKRRSEGDYIVDEGVLITSLNLSAGEKEEVPIQFRLPKSIRKGDYSLNLYFIAGKRYDWAGLMFTDEVVGASLPVTVQGSTAPLPQFDRSRTKINGERFTHIGWPKPFDQNRPLTVETTITNPHSESITGTLLTELKYWSGTYDKALKTERENITLNSGENKVLTNTLNQANFPVYFLRQIFDFRDPVTQSEAKSIINTRFATTAPSARFNAVGLEKFPFKASDTNKLFVCFHAVSEVPFSGIVKVWAKDTRGKTLAEALYEGEISPDLMAVITDFKVDYPTAQVKVEGEIVGEQNQVIDRANLVYSCADFDEKLCPKGIGPVTIPGFIQSFGKKELYIFGFVMSSLLVLLLLNMRLKPNKKSKNSSKFLPILLLPILIALLYPMPVRAEVREVESKSGVKKFMLTDRFYTWVQAEAQLKFKVELKPLVLEVGDELEFSLLEKSGKVRFPGFLGEAGDLYTNFYFNSLPSNWCQLNENRCQGASCGGNYAIAGFLYSYQLKPGYAPFPGEPAILDCNISNANENTCRAVTPGVGKVSLNIILGKSVLRSHTSPSFVFGCGQSDAEGTFALQNISVDFEIIVVDKNLDNINQRFIRRSFNNGRVWVQNTACEGYCHLGADYITDLNWRVSASETLLSVGEEVTFSLDERGGYLFATGFYAGSPYLYYPNDNSTNWWEDPVNIRTDKLAGVFFPVSYAVAAFMDDEAEIMRIIAYDFLEGSDILDCSLGNNKCLAKNPGVAAVGVYLNNNIERIKGTHDGPNPPIVEAVTFLDGPPYSLNIYGPAVSYTIRVIDNLPPQTMCEGVSTSSYNEATLNWGYADPEGHPQSAWQLQGSSQADFAFLDFNLQGEGANTSTTVTDLLPNTTYHWRIRVRDSHNLWSEWAACQPFTTKDVPKGVLQGRIFNDENSNGMMDEGEVFISEEIGIVSIKDDPGYPQGTQLGDGCEIEFPSAFKYRFEQVPYYNENVVSLSLENPNWEVTGAYYTHGGSSCDISGFQAEWEKVSRTLLEVKKVKVWEASPITNLWFGVKTAGSVCRRINANPSTVLVGEAVNLSADVSGGDLSYEWTSQGDAGSFDNPTKAGPVYTAPLFDPLISKVQLNLQVTNSQGVQSNCPSFELKLIERVIQGRFFKDDGGPLGLGIRGNGVKDGDEIFIDPPAGTVVEVRKGGQRIGRTDVLRPPVDSCGAAAGIRSSNNLPVGNDYEVNVDTQNSEASWKISGVYHARSLENTCTNQPRCGDLVCGDIVNISDDKKVLNVSEIDLGTNGANTSSIVNLLFGLNDH